MTHSPRPSRNPAQTRLLHQHSPRDSPWSGDGWRRGGRRGPPPSIRIDASRDVGEINPMLYGQFLEYMFQCIKGGLHAELIRNRSFEESAGAVGLSRYWEPYPDDRNHDFALDFAWDDSTCYPERRNPGHGQPGAIAPGRRPSRSDHAARRLSGGIPVDRGREYLGSLWLKTTGYDGRIEVTLESEVEQAVRLTPRRASSRSRETGASICSNYGRRRAIPWLGSPSSSTAGAVSGWTRCR